MKSKKLLAAVGFVFVRLAVTLYVGVIVTALTAAAYAQTGRIIGVVTAEDPRGPLVGATVEVIGPNLTKKMGTVSKAGGRYAVENVPSGTYAVKAVFIGYRSETVRDVAVAAEGSVDLHFQMVKAPYELEEMVVSASRRAENIVDASVSISKVDGKEIQRNTVGNSYISAVKNVKGIDYFQAGIFEQRVSARGFNSALNPRTQVFIDGRASLMEASGAGLPLYSTSETTAKDDVQDIEVIVGPGAALYGPNAVSGVISVTTKDPRDAQGTTFTVSAGSHDIFKGRFRHAGLRSRWGWKVSGEVQRAHDFEQVNHFFNADRTVSVTDDPDFNARNLRGGFELFYYPDDQSRVGFAAGASRANGVRPINTGRYQQEGYVYHYQQVTYTSPRLYLNIYRTGEDTGASYLLHTKAQFLVAGVSPDDAYQRARNIANGSLWGAEGRYNFDVPHLKNTHFNVGADFRQTRPNSNALDTTEGKIIVSQIGFYGHSETAMSEKFRVVLASRIDVHETYGTKISPKAALIFKPRPTTAFRATFNRAFKSPAILEQSILLRISPVTVARGNGKGFRFGSTTGGPLPAQFANGILKLKPEDNTTFEFGFKGVLANKVFLDVSGYRSLYEHFISPLRPIGDLAKGIVVLDEKGNPRKGEQTLTYLNFGRQPVLGFDLGVDVYATDRLVLRGNLSFIEAGKLEDAGGIDQPFNTPRTIFNLGLSTSDFLSKRTSLDVSLRRVSRFDFRSGVHVGTVPAYTVVDVNLGYRTRYGVTYKLSAMNILDNNHLEFVSGPRIGRVVVGEVQYAF